MKLSIVIGGVGGQGVISMGTVLAETARREGYLVKTNEVHGMAQRGGSVVFHFKMSDNEALYSPLVPERHADILIATEFLEALNIAHYAKSNGVLLVNDYIIEPTMALVTKEKIPSHQELSQALQQVLSEIIYIKAYEIAEEIGEPFVQNSVLLGALSSLKIFPIRASKVKKTIINLWPQYEEQNAEAFDRGREIILNVLS